MKLLTALFDRMGFLAELGTRAAIGVIFVQAGWGKFQNLGQVTGFFAGLGIPAPGLMTPFVAGVELIGGALLLIGFMTRLAAAPLIITMVVAQWTAHMDDVKQFTDIFQQKAVLIGLLLLWMLTHGPGRFSADAIWEVRRK